jgi:hypothetical protein
VAYLGLSRQRSIRTGFRDCSRETRCWDGRSSSVPQSFKRAGEWALVLGACPVKGPFDGIRTSSSIMVSSKGDEAGVREGGRPDEPEEDHSGDEGDDRAPWHVAVQVSPPETTRRRRSREPVPHVQAPQGDGPPPDAAAPDPLVPTRVVGPAAGGGTRIYTPFRYTILRTERLASTDSGSGGGADCAHACDGLDPVYGSCVAPGSCPASSGPGKTPRNSIGSQSQPGAGDRGGA